MKMLLVTGLSGAGKSTVLNILEDAGLETIDNVPLSILPLLLAAEGDENRVVVVGVGVRSRDFSPQSFSQAIDALRKNTQHHITTLFLDCADEVLQRRYKETRRKHPLAPDRPILSGIEKERQLLAVIQNQADIVIDTTDSLVVDLRHMVHRHFLAKAGPKLAIIIQSFSYKKGIPREADLVFDVRFLRNPHYVDDLRFRTGRDKEVGSYIAADVHFAKFFDSMLSLLLPLLPRYKAEGKSYLTIAIGCTGGRHRSVYVTEKLAYAMQEKGYDVTHSHRDCSIE